MLRTYPAGALNNLTSEARSISVKDDKSIRASFSNRNKPESKTSEAKLQQVYVSRLEFGTRS